MLELTWIPAALRVAAWALIGLALYALYAALTKPKTTASKAMWSLGVVTASLLFLFGPHLAGLGNSSKLDKAMAHFEMRCKGAGERITRTVENVEGVVWMKWRDKLDVNDAYDQFKLSDPYGRDCNAEGCIEQLLRVTSGAEKNPEEAARREARYRFVETIDPVDQKRYRYEGVIELPWSPEAIERHKKETGQSPPAFSHNFAVKRTLIDAYTARYGVTWDDISTREDREHWIAGGSLKVIDLQTNEVIAERVGYMMDRDLGSQGGGRQPWSYALRNACPSFPSDGTHTTRSWPHTETFIFVSKVLKPSKGE